MPKGLIRKKKEKCLSSYVDGWDLVLCRTDHWHHISKTEDSVALHFPIGDGRYAYVNVRRDLGSLDVWVRKPVPEDAFNWEHVVDIDLHQELLMNKLGG